MLKKLEDSAVDRDFLTFIKQLNDSKGPFAPLYSLSEAVAHLLAGTDTLSITLVNILYHLSSSPSTVQRLRAEIDSVDMPSLSSLEKLPLLTATIKEGLRLSHGVIGRLPRIAPLGGWTFEGTYVPEGTIISSSAPVVHNDPAIFSDPLEFIPERWMREDGPYNVAMEQHLVAFSKGQRSCIGMKYFPTSVSLTLVSHMQSCISVWTCCCESLSFVLLPERRRWRSLMFLQHSLIQGALSWK
jgi:cytochrome P450